MVQSLASQRGRYVRISIKKCDGVEGTRSNIDVSEAPAAVSPRWLPMLLISDEVLVVYLTAEDAQRLLSGLRGVLGRSLG